MRTRGTVAVAVAAAGTQSGVETDQYRPADNQREPTHQAVRKNRQKQETTERVKTSVQSTKLPLPRKPYSNDRPPPKGTRPGQGQLTRRRPSITRATNVSTGILASPRFPKKYLAPPLSLAAPSLPRTPRVDPESRFGRTASKLELPPRRPRCPLASVNRTQHHTKNILPFTNESVGFRILQG